MPHSMTGFASVQGEAEGFTWVWELRSVNGKGLDLRLRLPDWVTGLEAAARARITAALSRGSLSVGLRLSRLDTATALALNEAQLGPMLDALARVEAEAMDRGLTLAPSTGADILALRGLIDVASPDEIDPARLLPGLMSDLDRAIAELVAMRAAEGEALGAMITGQLDQVAGLIDAARAAVDARAGEAAETLRRNLARVLDNAEGLDADRLTQELALIAVKTDVTEEIDRLTAHVAAARELLATAGPVGRKLDFLMQEFNREANTLCAKAQFQALTRVGLDLKTVIDQMREQVQNAE